MWIWMVDGGSTGYGSSGIKNEVTIWRWCRWQCLRIRKNYNENKHKMISIEVKKLVSRFLSSIIMLSMCVCVCVCGEPKSKFHKGNNHRELNTYFIRSKNKEKEWEKCSFFSIAIVCSLPLLLLLFFPLTITMSVPKITIYV